MAWVGRTVTDKVIAMLEAPEGINACLALLAEADHTDYTAISASQLLAQNVSIEIAERSTQVRYPVLSVYCENVVNRLKEKFRSFSGIATVTIEVRVSQNRLDGIEKQLQLYVDAVTQVLDENRGDWGEGMFYGGCYEASFAAAKHGGQNFIQTGKVTFEVGASE